MSVERGVATVKCDRCGESAKCDERGYYPPGWKEQAFGTERDLCPDCAREVARAIGGAVVSPTETVKKK